MVFCAEKRRFILDYNLFISWRILALFVEAESGKNAV